MALQGQFGPDAVPALPEALARFNRSATSHNTVGGLHGLARAAVVADVTMMLLSLAVGNRAWQGEHPWATAAVLITFWIASIGARGAYDPRRIAVGSDEFKNVFSGTAVIFALAASLAYAVDFTVGRPLLLTTFVVGLLLLPLGRRVLRIWVFARRRAGAYLQKTLVIGEGAQRDELIDRLGADRRAGFEVAETMEGPLHEDMDQWLASVETVIRRHGIDAVAVTQTATINPEVIRRLSWRLEGPSVDLLVASSLTDITGPRLSVRPAAGLPLLHLEEPRLAGPQAIIKRGFDLVVSIVLLVLLSPVLLVTAVTIAATSRGPALFVQDRVGKGGSVYRLLKFRSMVDGADRMHEEVLGFGSATPDEYVADSRITPLGRFLRRWSIDELPQLVNVVRGQMSLVGPRPMLVEELTLLGDVDHRRHITKPGMTGLWQVAGRKEVPWDERMQMDLRYVENWSLALDLVIIAKTFKAVATGRGAH
jgi:exopolysaccharide biosynthesis polyprenyl glycosylphosphotransferase